jgi:hypothetical protein
MTDGPHEEETDDDEPWDLTKEVPTRMAEGKDLGPAEANIGRPAPSRTWNPTKIREVMRGTVALASFGLFAFVVAALVWAVVVDKRNWQDIQGIATSVLPVVVSVVGTTTGFYFGSKGGADI